MELIRFNRFADPFALVAVGGDGLFAAAQLVSSSGFAILYPLIVFHGACHADGKVFHAEDVVAHGVCRRRFARGVYETSVKVGIDILDVFHLDIVALRLVEHLCRFHCAPFIPPEEAGGAEEHHEACADAAERVLQTGAVARGSGFCVSHLIKC